MCLYACVWCVYVWGVFMCVHVPMHVCGGGNLSGSQTSNSEIPRLRVAGLWSGMETPSLPIRRIVFQAMLHVLKILAYVSKRVTHHTEDISTL